jgi:hypothetical protein
MSEKLTSYLLSLPERAIRSATALASGLIREIGEVTIPRTVRRSQLYQHLVEATLRFLIEQVGQVEGVYPDSAPTAAKPSKLNVAFFGKFSTPHVVFRLRRRLI